VRSRRNGHVDSWERGHRAISHGPFDTPAELEWR
jgi:hypothetical protein